MNKQLQDRRPKILDRVNRDYYLRFDFINSSHFYKVVMLTRIIILIFNFFFFVTSSW